MEKSLIDYTSMLFKLKISDIEKMIQILYQILPDKWREEYQKMTSMSTNIIQFNYNNFEFLFDYSSELIMKGIISHNQAVEDRVIAVFGRSQPNSRKRDANRMKGFLGLSSKIFGNNYDKGHFIGHVLGGGLDVNLFPQLRDINRGWSMHGKVFRAMERYCAKNIGTFCFSRPLYYDRTWIPAAIEYGVLMSNHELWVEIFDN
jgi:hypothetical protein